MFILIFFNNKEGKCLYVEILSLFFFKSFILFILVLVNNVLIVKFSYLKVVVILIIYFFKVVGFLLVILVKCVILGLLIKGFFLFVIW